MDFVGPLPKTNRGNMYILSVIDHGSRYAWAKPVKHQTAQVVANFIYEQIYLVHGPPKFMLTQHC